MALPPLRADRANVNRRRADAGGLSRDQTVNGLGEPLPEMIGNMRHKVDVLTQGAHYAYLLTTGIKTTAGAALVADPDLSALLSSDRPAGAAARAATAYAPLRAYLAANAIDPATIVGATVFTTADYTPELLAARHLLDSKAPSAAVFRRVPRLAHRVAQVHREPLANRGLVLDAQDLGGHGHDDGGGDRRRV